MLRTTVLHDEHRRLGARLVDFAGWEMPIQYRSQLDEHHAVRSGAGMFDVSHMCAVDVDGPGATPFLQRLLANDVAKLTVIGRALYSPLLNEAGGILDDLIVYRTGESAYRIVVNAGTAEADIAWFQQQAPAEGVALKPRRDLSILAVQGPAARERVLAHLPEALRASAAGLSPFQAAWDGEWFVGRTGYTGEDGFELILPHEAVLTLWATLLEDGVQPCGLGARDTLRLEAGMNLYGQDMTVENHPLESGLGWTVAWAPEARDFIGRATLEPLRGVPHARLVGLVLEGRGVLRAHMPVRFANGRTGETTSGSFAPTLKASIALARVEAGYEGSCEVEIRGQWLPARVVKPPFVRNGKTLI